MAADGAGPAADPEVITFGCRLNTYESEIIRRHARAAGLCNAVIVNTCAVTAEAERQARQSIRKARRRRPDARIIVTGCAAQIDPARYAGLREVDRVLGNREKLSAASFDPDRTEAIAVDDIASIRDTAPHPVDGIEGRTRAVVQVQSGCDHGCTFCIIPRGRGPNRSVPVGAVVDQARRLVAGGYREVVLSGVDLTSFGRDLPGRPRLGALVRRLLRLVPELRRLRLSSVDPAEVDEELLRLFADEPRLMPHLHLSLQAGDDLVLKRMKRRHDRRQAIALCDALRRRRPDIVFGADLIAGFPTESEAMFERTLRLVDDCGLTYLHVFPYSPRPGTPAARMPPVAAEARKARAARLRTAGEAARRRYFEAQVGTAAEVLVEDARSGRTPHYAAVELDRAAGSGDLVTATIVGVRDDRLVGRLAP